MTQPMDKLEAAVVREYLAGGVIPDICARHGIDEWTMYDILKRSGAVPNRRRKRTGNDDTDAILAGLYQLADYQSKRILDLEREVKALKRAAQNRERAARRAAGA